MSDEKPASSGDMLKRIEELEDQVGNLNGGMRFLRLLTTSQFALIASLAGAGETWADASSEMVDDMAQAANPADRKRFQRFFDEYKNEIEGFRDDKS